MITVNVGKGIAIPLPASALVYLKTDINLFTISVSKQRWEQISESQTDKTRSKPYVGQLISIHVDDLSSEASQSNLTRILTLLEQITAGAVAKTGTYEACLVGSSILVEIVKPLSELRDDVATNKLVDGKLVPIIQTGGLELIVKLTPVSYVINYTSDRSQPKTQG